MYDWREEAWCLDDPYLWDTPDSYERGTAKRVREAEATNICNTKCPVVQECLADALSFETPGSAYNVRGGKTPDERKAILKEIARQRDIENKRKKRLEAKEAALA